MTTPHIDDESVPITEAPVYFRLKNSALFIGKINSRRSDYLKLVEGPHAPLWQVVFENREKSIEKVEKTLCSTG